MILQSNYPMDDDSFNDRYLATKPSIRSLYSNGMLVATIATPVIMG